VPLPSTRCTPWFIVLGTTLLVSGLAVADEPIVLTAAPLSGPFTHPESFCPQAHGKECRETGRTCESMRAPGVVLPSDLRVYVSHCDDKNGETLETYHLVVRVRGRWYAFSPLDDLRHEPAPWNRLWHFGTHPIDARHGRYELLSVTPIEVMGQSIRGFRTTEKFSLRSTSWEDLAEGERHWFIGIGASGRPSILAVDGSVNGYQARAQSSYQTRDHLVVEPTRRGATLKGTHWVYSTGYSNQVSERPWASELTFAFP
jgi:hypothetical protein